MPYGFESEVRKQSGNLPEEEVSDFEIKRAVLAADRVINVNTGKTNWASTDDEYEMVQMMSNLYAAALIRDKFADPDGKSAEFKMEFWKLLESLKLTSESSEPNEQVLLKTGGSET